MSSLTKPKRKKFYSLQSIAPYYKVAGGLDSATIAWVNAVVAAGGTVSGGRQTVVDTYIKALKSAGLFAKLDRYWLFAGENTQSANIDLISLGVFTNQGMAFSANEGYTANGTSTYGDTGLNVATAGGNFALNSAMFGVYITNNRVVSSSGNPVAIGMVGATDATYLQFDGAGFAKGYINTAYNGPLDYSSAISTQGSWMGTRTSSSRVDLYRQATSVTNNSSSTSSAIATGGNMFVGAGDAGGGAPNFYSPDNYAAAFVGGGFSGADVVAFDAAQSALMTSIRGFYPGTTTTLNPSAHASNITLSNGNLTATAAVDTLSPALSTVAHPSGLLYFETHIDVNPGANFNAAVGIANASQAFANGNFLGQDNNGIGYYGNGKWWINNAGTQALATFVAGNTIGVAVNRIANKIWFTLNGTTWNNDIIGNQNPIGVVGGIDISAITGPIYAGVETDGTTVALTANFGATAYAYTPPAGYSNW